VRRLKAIVTVMVLAVWAVCTAHCTIENLTGASEPSCCKEEGGQSGQVPVGPGQCVCSVIQAGGYVSHDNALLVPVPVRCLPLGNILCDSEDPLRRTGVVEATLSPPEVVRSWQFCFRTALPVRAPSLIS